MKPIEFLNNNIVAHQRNISNMSSHFSTASHLAPKPQPRFSRFDTEIGHQEIVTQANINFENLVSRFHSIRMQRT